jgi:hypothetical protein
MMKRFNLFRVHLFNFSAQGNALKYVDMLRCH